MYMLYFKTFNLRTGNFTYRWHFRWCHSLRLWLWAQWWKYWLHLVNLGRRSRVWHWHDTVGTLPFHCPWFLLTLWPLLINFQGTWHGRLEQLRRQSWSWMIGFLVSRRNRVWTSILGFPTSIWWIWPVGPSGSSRGCVWIVLRRSGRCWVYIWGVPVWIAVHSLKPGQENIILLGCNIQNIKIS